MSGYTLCIPGLPPSTNNAFVNLRSGGRALSREASLWKAGVGLAVACSRPPEIIGQVEVTLTFYSENWLTKKGKSRKVDLANFEKLFVDAVFKGLGVDDSEIFRLVMHKKIGPDSSVIVVRELAEVAS